MIVHEITTKVKAGGQELTVKSVKTQGDYNNQINREIPAGAQNVQFNIAIPINSTLLSLAMSCKRKPGEEASLTFNGLTIKTNSTSTPGDSKTITPTNGICWTAGDSEAVPLTSAVTALYVSNNGTAAGILDVVALIDNTPGLTG